ncbi:hypothetical protein ACFPC0_19260 [Streptomyces andamanensis]|uniref:Uncharacterized protein n=1 Tax=Streptomyces andamanensis TaxID=1565035 RepID=A0ABV8TGX9_9ACTN
MTVAPLPPSPPDAPLPGLASAFLSSSEPPHAVRESASAPATATAASLAEERVVRPVRPVRVAWLVRLVRVFRVMDLADRTVRMVPLVLRITAPFFVLVERPSTVPWCTVLRRGPRVGKSARDVNGPIVTRS